jgi:ribosomal subunit interface protein
MVAITISGVRYNISDKIRQHVEDKMVPLRRFNPDLQRVHVTIHEAEKHGYRIDVEMHLPNHHDVIAHDTEETVYSAIDCVIDKCAAQLRKLHDKQARGSQRRKRA